MVMPVIRYTLLKFFSSVVRFYTCHTSKMEQICDTSGNQFWLVLIPGDGDCLFGSIVHQIFGMTPKHPLFKTYSQQVRELAVSEIRRNLHLYYETVASYADELITSCDSTTAKIELYLRRLQSAGYWGGADSIAALSNHYNVIFCVHQHNSRIEFSPTNSEIDAPPRHHLFYGNSPGINGESSQGYVSAHYDSILCIRLFGTVMQVPDAQIFQLHGSPSNLRIKLFGADPNALFHSVLHQLTGELPSAEMLYLIQCLVADEIETQPRAFLSASGIPCETTEDVSQFAFRLRIGHHNGGLASLLLLSAMLHLTIFVHHPIRGIVRYDPSAGQSTMSIQIFENPETFGTTYGSIVAMEPLHPRPSVRRVLPDPMEVAQKVARRELTDSQMTDYPSRSVDPKRGLRFASLNVNGCRPPDKREAIDSLLHSQQVQLAVLQEVNLDCQYVTTSHYHWHMSGSTKNKRRGLAILVHRELNGVVQKNNAAGSHIQHAEIFYQVGQRGTFLNQCCSVYIFIGRWRIPYVGRNQRTWAKSFC